MQKSHRSLRQKLKSVLSVQLSVMLAVVTVFSIAPSRPVHADAETVYTDASQIDVSGDDNTSTSYAMPFSFTLFGNQTFDHFHVDTNGRFYPEGTSDQVQLNVFSNDLNSYAAKSIYTKTIGDTPGSRKFVVQWTNFGMYGAGMMPFSTFMVIFNENDNSVQYQYRYILRGNRGQGSEAYIGIYNYSTGHHAIYSENNATLGDNTAVKFTPDGGGLYTIDDGTTYQPILLQYSGQPGAPTLAGPSDGATNVSLGSSVSWTAASQATDYWVVMSRYSDFRELESPVETHVTSGTTVNLADINVRPNTKYYWVVIAANTDGTELSAIHSFTTGDGDIREVSNCTELQNASDSSSLSTIKLTGDIDCNGVDFVPLNWDGRFKGTLDGQNHTIHNLTIDRGSDSYIALIGQADGATIKNLTLDGGSVSGGGVVGSVLGEGQDTTITNVHSNLTVTAINNNGYAGGLVGSLYYEQMDGVVSYSSFTGDVVGGTTNAVGGLVGEMDVYAARNAGIQKSYTTGTVAGGDNVGGLMGYAYVENTDSGMDPAQLSISESYSQSAVAAAGNSGGGIIGRADGYNDDSDSVTSISLNMVYSSGQVDVVNDGGGGLIGGVEPETTQYNNQTLAITHSFATSHVNADTGGFGLVGSTGFYEEGSAGEFRTVNNYFDVHTTNQSSGVAYDVSGMAGVDIDGTQQDLFKNNHTTAPLDIWDFSSTWLTTDSFPVLVASNYAPPTELLSAEDQSTIAIEQSGCTAVDSASAQKESGLTVQDVAYSYPKGFASFNLTGCEQGGTATVSATFVGSLTPADVVARKYNSTTHSYTTIDLDSKIATTLGSHPAIKITYQITDGGPLDQDGQANGVIVDPVGLGVQVVVAPNTGLR